MHSVLTGVEGLPGCQMVLFVGSLRVKAAHMHVMQGSVLRLNLCSKTVLGRCMCLCLIIVLQSPGTLVCVCMYMHPCHIAHISHCTNTVVYTKTPHNYIGK